MLVSTVLSKNILDILKRFIPIFSAIFITQIIILAYSMGKIQNIEEDRVIIDSNYSLEEIFENEKIPLKIKKNLRLISVTYFSFDNKLHQGQILIHKDLVSDLHEIFKIIGQKKFPIDKVIPINHYNWSDELSMNANNTSAFNYRFVKGTKKLSPHAVGRAIDINPLLNPQIKKGKIFPVDANYNPEIEGTITANSFLVKEFTKRGWKWGGNWRSLKDYQHFEKLK